MALELQDWGAHGAAQAKRSSRSGSSGSDDDSSSRRGRDVPAGVSVMPLLSAADSSAAQILYTRGPSSTQSHNSLHASALMRSDSRGEEKESGAGESDRLSQPHSNGGSSDSSKPIISAKNIHKTYLLGLEGVPALRGVTLDIARAEFLIILGSSGGGKTSLLNILGTIDQPTKGELSIAGHRITINTTDEEFAFLRLRKIGFVFQSFNLLPSMTAEENVSLPMILDGRLSAKEISARAKELLQRVGLGERTTHLPSQLSGGEQQRVTIARAIANRPAILLLDEPTGDLDTINGTLILSLLLHLNRLERMTCIMVTHDTQLKNYAHRVVHMVDGKVARLETISPSTRAEMDAALDVKVRQIRGEYSGEVPVKQEPTTEFRSADSYPGGFLRDDEDD